MRTRLLWLRDHPLRRRNRLKQSYYELLRLWRVQLTDHSESCSTLPSKDFCLLLETRCKLSAEWMSLTAIPSSSQCSRKNDSTKASCPSLSSGKAGWYKIVHESGLAQDFAYDPIHGLIALIRADWKAERFCDECTKKWQDEWRETKKELWSKLDEWLHIAETEAKVSTFLRPYCYHRLNSLPLAKFAEPSPWK